MSRRLHPVTALQAEGAENLAADFRIGQYPLRGPNEPIGAYLTRVVAEYFTTPELAQETLP